MGQSDGQTDGRNPDRYVDPVPHTMWAVSITYIIKQYDNIMLVSHMQQVVPCKCF